MPVLPVPMIIALLLAAFLAHRVLTKDTHFSLLVLIGACAVQSAIIALVHYYGVSALRPLQPLFAMLIGPIAWFAFLQAAGGAVKIRVMAAHGLGIVAAMVCLVVQPMLLDALIPLSFTSYGIAMLLRLARGEESLPHSLLEGAGVPVLAWRVVGISLIASAFCDVLIAASLATGSTTGLPWIPSLVSSLSLLSLGVLSLTHAMESRRVDDGERVSLTPEDQQRDTVIISRLDDLMASAKPYLDPDLTLARLSRKLLVPAKQLSAAINRVKGENLSRYVNRQRIAEVCRRLENGQSVTAAMLEAGFNTKSNFNREFLRVTGQNPREWLSQAQGHTKAKCR
jgi:AraC-like DNA-binding protein